MSPAHRHDSELTTSEILAAARQLFAEQGYAAAQTTQIVDQVGLTRGALYHHYGSKTGLFEAVVERIQAELAESVQATAAGAPGDALDQLRAGFTAYLDLATQPDVRQVLLIDGPSVLGWQRWYEIDSEHAFASTRAAVARAVDRGEMRIGPVDEMTRLLLGALTHAALAIGAAPDVGTSLRQHSAAIDLLLAGLSPAS
ncbi:MAG: TetR/AcrR family transcriptional regulator [Actinomycetota bacterium]